MDSTTMIYIRVVLGVGALVLVGRTLLRQRSRSPSNASEAQRSKIVERQSSGSRRLNPSGSVPSVIRTSAVDPQISVLEAHVRNAIFSADGRERLIKDAMRSTSGDRAAAIRKVLSDLHAENNRWS